MRLDAHAGHVGPEARNGVAQRRGREPGFSLLELVVVITVLGILAGAISPVVVQQILDARIEATRAEARLLHEAMLGQPAQGVFGFVGDLGRLPNTFQELAQPGALPLFGTAGFRGVGMGWRGPYVNSGSSATDYLTDAFGRSYTGAPSGQVRSPGPDGIANNADDIVYPPAAPTVTGTVSVTVNETSGSPTNPKITVDPAGYRVDLYYTVNGAEASVSDAAAPFVFTGVYQGPHAVRVVRTANPGAGTVVSQTTITVRPGSTTAAELWF
jgi:general secretion pathway protein G